MAQINVYWRGERVGRVRPLATYDMTTRIKYADGSGFAGSLGCIVQQMRAPNTASIREVMALDLVFDREFYLRHGDSRKVELEEAT